MATPVNVTETPLEGHLGLAHPPGLVVFADSVVLVNAFETICGWLLVLFFYSRFVLENLMPRIYGDIYTQKMTVKEQRSFICHHSWLTVKFLALSGALPFVNIILKSRNIIEPAVSGGNITNGDILSVLFMGIIASFVFELYYRLEISYVSMIHHVSAIVLACWQIGGELQSWPLAPGVESTREDALQNATQFKLIMLYGSFEVVFESWMHACSIAYRLYKGNPTACARLWGLGGAYVLFGAFFELAVMIFFWTRYFHVWNTLYKVLMPTLHVAFMAAQLHGARLGFMLRRRFVREARELKEQQAKLATSDQSINGDASTIASLPSIDIPESIDSSKEEPYRRSSVVQLTPMSATTRRAPWLSRTSRG